MTLRGALLLAEAAVRLAAARVRKLEVPVAALTHDAELVRPPAYVCRRCLRTASAVRRSARLVPGATCLVQAVVLQRMLRARKIDTVIRIGVTKEGGQFGAHAWVEYGGQVILGAPVESYSMLAQAGVLT